MSASGPDVFEKAEPRGCHIHDGDVLHTRKIKSSEFRHQGRSGKWLRHAVGDLRCWNGNIGADGVRASTCSGLNEAFASVALIPSMSTKVYCSWSQNIN